MTRSETFEIARPGNLVVRGDAYLADGAKTGVLVVHGFKGFARWGFFPHLARRIAEAGMNAIAVDLSGSGIGADRESFTETDAFHNTTWSRDLDDLAAAAEEATRRGWFGARYGVFGHSRGGGEAILHADSQPRVGGLVTWASISTLMRWTAPQRASWRDRGWLDVPNSRTGQVLTVGTAFLDETEALAGTPRDIPTAAARLSIPWLIVHGQKDDVVPFDEALALRANAASGNANVLGLDDAGHTFNVAHPMHAASPALNTAVDATVELFHRALR
jgi:dienelactone hydrolase